MMIHCYIGGGCSNDIGGGVVFEPDVEAGDHFLQALAEEGFDGAFDLGAEDSGKDGSSESGENPVLSVFSHFKT